MNFNFKFFIVGALVIISLFLRLYQIDKVPPSLNIDEASEGYNAYSLLHTGKDRYGEKLPILFRSFGSFQAPLYTYLTIIPIFLFGNTIFAVRLVAVLSGVVLVVITFFLTKNYYGKKEIAFATIASLTVALSPWSVFFSRFGTEAILGVALFSLSLMIFYISLKRFYLFPLATLLLGLSTHAYYSERLISVFFLGGFIFLFKKIISLKRRLFIIGIVVFLLTQIPHLLIANSGAFTRRINQVDYFSGQFFQNNSGELRSLPLGRLLFVVREFISHYITYFSPKNLFFDPDPQQERSIPDLSVFYSWMLIPFSIGMRKMIRDRAEPLIKMLLLTMLISLIPAALTRDPFYTLRTLVFLWTIAIMIAFGIYNILNSLSSALFKFSLVLLILAYSSLSLYRTYFTLFKYQRAVFDYTYMKLWEKTNQFPDKQFVIDNSRHLAVGVRHAFFQKFDPDRIQKDFKPKVRNFYYSGVEIEEKYVLDNIQARPIIWEEDICKDQILVGDLLAISSEQVEEHSLKPLFDIKDRAGDISLKAYLTNPSKCKLL